MKILFLGPECPSIEDALAHGKCTYIRTEEKFSYEWLVENTFDFCISYRYKHILKEDIISFFAGKCVNLHISYLPWNKGTDPNLWSYLENTPQGVSVHLIDVGVDTGAILLQRKVDIDIKHDTLRASYEKLSAAIEQLFIDNMMDIFAEKITPRRQDEGGSFHLSKDKTPYLPLIEKLWWDTPVVNLLEKEKEKEKEGLNLVQATDAYCDFVFSVVNDCVVRAMSFQSKAISYDEHKAWFARQMEQNLPFYIALCDDKPCGYVRLDRRDEKANISLALDVNFRTKGLAADIIRKSTHKFLREYDVQKIIAHVKNDNKASKSVFKKAFYIESKIKIQGKTMYYYPEDMSC